MAATLKSGQFRFHGGMAPDFSDMAVGDDQCEFMANVNLSAKPGAVEQIKGASWFQSVQGAAETAGVEAKTIFRFYKSNGTAQTIVSWQAGVVAGVSEVDAVNETLIDNTIGTAIINYAVYQDNLYMVNGTSSLYKYDGTTFSTAATFPTIGGAPFAPTLIWTHKGRTYYAGDAALPSTIIWSDPDLPATLSASNFQTIQDDDGDVITSLYSQGQNLVAFKERRTFIIEGSPPQRITPLTNERVGTIHHKTVQRTPYGLIFLSHQGVYMLNGSQVTNLSGQMQQQLRTLVSTAQSDYSSAFHKGVYYLFYRPYSQVTITEGLSFDFNLITDAPDTGTRVPIVKLNYFNVNHSAVFDGSIDSEEWYACMSGTNNIIRVDGSTTTWYYNTASPTESMDPLVVSRWHDMGEPSLEKELLDLYVFFHATVVNMLVNIQYEYRGTRYTQNFTINETAPAWDSAIWDVSLWGGQHSFMHRIRLPAGTKFDRIQARFSADGAGDVMNLDGYQFAYNLLPEV